MKPTTAAKGNVTSVASPPSAGATTRTAANIARARSVSKPFKPYSSLDLYIVRQIGTRLSLDQKSIVSAQFLDWLRGNPGDEPAFRLDLPGNHGANPDDASRRDATSRGHPDFGSHISKVADADG